MSTPAKIIKYEIFSRFLFRLEEALRDLLLLGGLGLLGLSRGSSLLGGSSLGRRGERIRRG